MNEGKIFNKHGKLKKIITPKQLEIRHWSHFQSDKTAYSNKRGPITIPGTKSDHNYKEEA